MKKKKFLKKFGQLTVKLATITTDDALEFVGSTGEDQSVLVVIRGSLMDLPFTIDTNSNYPLKFMANNFPTFDKAFYVDLANSPYMVSCLISADE